MRLIKEILEGLTVKKIKIVCVIMKILLVLLGFVLFGGGWLIVETYVKTQGMKIVTLVVVSLIFSVYTEKSCEIIGYLENLKKNS